MRALGSIQTGDVMGVNDERVHKKMQAFLQSRAVRRLGIFGDDSLEYKILFARSPVKASSVDCLIEIKSLNGEEWYARAISKRGERSFIRALDCIRCMMLEYKPEEEALTAAEELEHAA